MRNHSSRVCYPHVSTDVTHNHIRPYTLVYFYIGRRAFTNQQPARARKIKCENVCEKDDLGKVSARERKVGKKM